MQGAIACLVVMALLLGCWNCVVSPAPISKPRQSITALVVVWFTVSVVPALLIAAAPALTTPPTGFANARLNGTVNDENTANPRAISPAL